jgi:AcrR family transcriptional regulator
VSPGERPARRVYGGRSAADRRAERRERLLAAGLDLFGTDGYAASSIERLCAAAAVSTRTFYEEFSGREALLTELYAAVIEKALHAVEAAVAEAEDGDLEARIALAVRAYVTTTAKDPRWAKLVYVEVVGVSEAVERHRLAWRERWVNMLIAEAGRAAERAGRGLAAGGDGASSRDHHLGAVALVGAVNELVYHWAIGGYRIPLEGMIAEIVRLAHAALGSG